MMQIWATSHICSESFLGPDHSYCGQWCEIVDLNQVPAYKHDGYILRGNPEFAYKGALQSSSPPVLQLG